MLTTIRQEISRSDTNMRAAVTTAKISQLPSTKGWGEKQEGEHSDMTLHQKSKVTTGNARRLSRTSMEQSEQPAAQATKWYNLCLPGPHFQQGFKKLYDGQFGFDCTLMVEGLAIKVHKVVLASASDLFKPQNRPRVGCQTVTIHAEWAQTTAYNLKEKIHPHTEKDLARETKIEDHDSP
uniref:BTB domain-containing protein n=1 Tax=Timema tahoe TaxID=61484 RepID=A0A7R9P179_9NEOP|nr:unnamed protein product [Timema tahoe]